MIMFAAFVFAACVKSKSSDSSTDANPDNTTSSTDVSAFFRLSEDLSLLESSREPHLTFNGYCGIEGASIQWSVDAESFDQDGGTCVSESWSVQINNLLKGARSIYFRLSDGSRDFVFSKQLTISSLRSITTIQSDSTDVLQSFVVCPDGTRYYTFTSTGNMEFETSAGTVTTSTANNLVILKQGQNGVWGDGIVIEGTSFYGGSGRNAQCGSDNKLVISPNLFETHGTVNIDPKGSTAVNIACTAGSNRCSYIAKFNTDLTLEWHQFFQAVNAGDTNTPAIIIAPDNSIIVALVWTGETFLDGTASAVPTGASTNHDTAFTKFDSDGNYVTSRMLSIGTGVDLIRQLEIHPDGDKVVFVGFTSSAAFDFDVGNAGGEVSATAFSRDGVFGTIMISDISHDSVYLIPGNDRDELHGLRVTEDSYYLLGGTYGTLDLDFDSTGNTFTHSGSGVASCFVIKVGLDGSYVWGNGFPSDNCTFGLSALFEKNNGNIVVTLSAYGITDIDPGPGIVDPGLTSASDSDLVIAEFSPSGDYVSHISLVSQVPSWNTIGRLFKTSGDGYIMALSTDAIGVNFDPEGVLTIPSTSEDRDLHIIEFNP